MPDFVSTQSKLPDQKANVYQSGLPNDEKRPETQDDDDFLLNARKRFNRCIVAESENRKNGIDDLMFKNGDQWPAAIRTDRVLQKRPCLTINKMKTFVHQIVNNMRQNRPAIDISPVGDGSDRQVAQMLKGLIRQIERQSCADIAYDTAFESAVSNGWGYWRILTEYESDESFNQNIRIESIRNPMRVYLDPDHQLPDGSDAKFGFISDLIPREEFEELYPNAEQVPFDDGGMGDDTFKDWSTLTHVRIAEYFCFKSEKRTLVATTDGQTFFEDEIPEEAKKLVEASPELIVNKREVMSKRVLWTKITAHQVLEENEWPGAYIPIVKVSGDVIDIEGKATMAGIIRDAKDPQRMKNYWATAKTELIALAPKAPFILEEGQIEGHEQRWQQANQKSYPYLLYKGTNIGGNAAPPPQRQPFAGPPAGVIEAEQSAEQDMMGTTGVRFDATKSERIPDESGKALRELKFLGELGSYHYTANYVTALKYTARQFIDLIPKIYDARRVVTILREDNSDEQVVIEPQLQVPFQTAPNPNKMGSIQKLYNPGLGKYDVAVNEGPNFQTKRAEAREGMMDFMRSIGPAAAQVIGGPLARNQDWPGADEIADRMDAMLPPQVINKQLDKLGDVPPQAKAMIGSLQSQLQQASQQAQQMAQELQDKKSEQAIQVEKIEKDYDAKIMKIGADLKMHVETLLNERLRDMNASHERGFKDGSTQGMTEMQRRDEMALRRQEPQQTAPAGSGA